LKSKLSTSHESSESPESAALALDLIRRGIVRSARFLVLGGLEFDVLRAAYYEKLVKGRWKHVVE
jgi:hypothetical protein